MREKDHPDFWPNKAKYAGRTVALVSGGVGFAGLECGESLIFFGTFPLVIIGAVVWRFLSVYLSGGNIVKLFAIISK